MFRRHCSRTARIVLRIDYGNQAWIFEHVKFDDDDDFKRKGGVKLIMELEDTKQVILTATAFNEIGHPTNPKFSFTSDNPVVAVITDNGDGTVLVVSETGGVANIIPVSTDADGFTFTGEPFVVTITAGHTSKIVVSPGTPTLKGE